jgi:CBS domain containing-hemolysin-like protein
MAGETGHSRFPVFGADLDDIRGVVHVKALHSLPPADRSVVRVEELMGEALAVPETVALEDLLFDLQATRNHLAVVVDEYGGTAGVVTLEDLVEEIVGEIADEHDADESMLTVVDRVGEWVLPGTAHPDEVEDLTGFVVPEGDYETLAGFLLDRLGFIPDAPGDLVEDEGWYLSVVEVDGLRIAQVRLVAPATDVAEADGSPRT